MELPEVKKEPSMIKTATQKPILTILATYVFHNRNRVCFSIKSLGSGEKYNVCFDNNHSSCTCDGNAKWHKNCYHITELAPRAASIIARQQSQARTAYTALYDPCLVA